MAHVPAERCLGIIELLADSASSMPLGEIAERLELPKSGAHRLLATLVDLGWAEKDPDTGFYRLTMRLAVLGPAVLLCIRRPRHLPAAARPAGASSAASSRDSPSSTGFAGVDRARAGRDGRSRLSALGHHRPRAAVRDGERQGMARDAAAASDAMSRRRQNGGFDDADRYGPNVIRSIEVLMQRASSDGSPGLWVGTQRGGAWRHGDRGGDSSGAGGAALGTVSIAGPTARA